MGSPDDAGAGAERGVRPRICWESVKSFPLLRSPGYVSEHNGGAVWRERLG